MCKKWEVSTLHILTLKCFFNEFSIIKDLINVKISATNDYLASVNVTEDTLSLGGGWSEKMSSPITGGGGHRHALVSCLYSVFVKAVF